MRLRRQTLVCLTLLILLSRLPARAELVAHWRFDEAQGTTVSDYSGFGNHGTLLNPGAGTWTNGVSGGALYFDGTTGTSATYVTVPDSPYLHLTNQASFAAWVRWDDTSRDCPIIAKEGDGALSYWFGAFGPGHFGVLFDLDGNQPWSLLDRDQGTVRQGEWVHLASTWDGQMVRHFLNGFEFPDTVSFQGPIFPGTGPLAIGANAPYNSTAFKGMIDDVRVYNHPLTPQEVRALAGTVQGMVGCWTFDEGSGTAIADTSGRANHGTIVNPKAATWTTGIRGAALYFDGSIRENSTYLSIPDSPTLRIQGPISFAAWVRCDDITRDAPILAKEGDGKLSYWFGAFGVNVDGAVPGNFGVLLDLDGNPPWTVLDRNQGFVPQGQWTHLASTWDGTTIRHYQDGSLLSETATFSGPIWVSDAFLAIGANSLYNYTAFKGAIDEVRLYSLALTDQEVRTLYLESGFRITSLVREGDGLRITWPCLPGRTYVVQTNAAISAAFGDYVQLTIPQTFTAPSTNVVHASALTSGQALFYRVKLLP